MRLVSQLSLACLLCGCAGDQGQGALSRAQAFVVEAGRAPVPAGELYYEMAGSGETVVFIHGNAGDLRHWDAQFEALASEYRVLRYDVRGFGRSSAPVPGQPFSGYADLAALLTHLGIPRAHVVGWSMGAGIAADFALAYPGMTASLVSVAPWINGYSSPAARQLASEIGAVVQAGRERGTAAAVETWVNSPFWVATVRDSAAAERFRYIASAQSWMPPPGRLVRERLQPRAPERIADLAVPLLIVTAEYDIPADVEVADLLEEAVGGARRVTMSDTGHMMHMERPEEFNEILREFLESVDG